MASGFANNATQWWVDGPGATGNQLNGGGYDSTVTNAGTNYADAATFIVSSTTGANVVASTTFTDSSNPFTAAMIGNVLRISAATGGTAAALDYYMITAYASAGSITLDRAVAVTTNVTACTYRVGGRHPNLNQYVVGGTGTPQPTLASPLIAGNTVNLRGNGSLDSATIDYDMSNGFWQFPNGGCVASLTSGSIKVIGYNGRPNIGYAGVFSTNTNGQCYWFKNVKISQTLGTWVSGGGHNVFDSGTVSYYNCIFDFLALDTNGPCFGDSNNQGASMIACEVRNTGGGAAGTGQGALHNHGGGFLFGNWIHGVRGDGIVGVGCFGSHVFNLINANKRYGFNDLETDGSRPIPHLFINNTFDANVNNCFNMGTMAILNNLMWNNLFTNHTNLFVYTDSLVLNTQRYRFIQYNDYYLNTTNFNGTPATWGLNKTVDAGFSGDITSNPTYSNSAGNDFTPTANVLSSGVAWVNTLTTTTYTLAMGAIQP